MATQWPINSVCPVQWHDMVDVLQKPPPPIPDATVTGRLLYKSTLTEVPGSSFSLPVTDVLTGRYGGVAPALESLVSGGEYICELVAVKSGVTIGRRRFLVVAGYPGMDA